METTYLTGVPRIQSNTFSGIEIIGNGNDTWYAGSYQIVSAPNFQESKKSIVDISNKVLKINSSPNDWHWHHVVEQQHLAIILFAGNLFYENNFKMPTVLIYNQQHRYLSQNTNNSAFRELSSISKGDVRLTPAQEYLTPEGREVLKSRIAGLQMMYGNLYRNYPTFSTIANNVFNAFSRMLR